MPADKSPDVLVDFVDELQAFIQNRIKPFPKGYFGIIINTEANSVQWVASQIPIEFTVEGGDEKQDFDS